MGKCSAEAINYPSVENLLTAGACVALAPIGGALRKMAFSLRELVLSAPGE